MGKRKYYLTLDTETATLPFANEICKTAIQKQKIAIAKPLVYDIGWCITTTQGDVIKQVNYLVQETFFVPQVFNTAYYKEKRPLYMAEFTKGALKSKPWNDIIKELIEDLQFCNLTVAYNACFDFKKAIPFTENYIYHLYNDINFQNWEYSQRVKCLAILNGEDNSQNEEFLNPVFKIRGFEFPIADLWGISCERLINILQYKKYCLDNSYLTASAKFFKTSAETTYQFIMDKYDFIEDHTALSDALIESQILAKALKKGKISPNITAFPFRELGDTFEFIEKYPQYKPTVATALGDYLMANEEKLGSNRYWRAMEDKYENLLLEVGL